MSNSIFLGALGAPMGFVLSKAKAIGATCPTSHGRSLGGRGGSDRLSPRLDRPERLTIEGEEPNHDPKKIKLRVSSAQKHGLSPRIIHSSPLPFNTTPQLMFVKKIKMLLPQRGKALIYLPKLQSASQDINRLFSFLK